MILNVPQNVVVATCQHLLTATEVPSVAPTRFSNIFWAIGCFWWGRSVLKKLHSIHFMLNYTNFMKKRGPILVTNTKEFMFNEKYYLTKALSGVFIKFRSEKMTFL